MHKTWLIFKNEIITTVTRPSFLFTLFGLPIIMAVIFAVIGMINREQPGQVEQFFTPAADPLPSGLVDNADIISEMPEEYALVAYADEKSARQALAEDQITGFYIISSDYMQSGNITYVREDFNPISGFEKADTIQGLINMNLVKSDPFLAERINQMMNLETVNINPKPERAQESVVSMLAPMAIVILFYIILVSASSLLMNSITREKENRVMEILMSSVDALQILAGKITALGIIGLLQIVVWSGSGMLLMGFGKQAQIFDGSLYLSPALLGWAVPYFLAGYLLYASLMAGVGAMATNLREGSQVTSYIMMPMIIPMVFINNLIQAPNGTLAVVLSLVPFTSPMSMIARIAATDLPFWQPLLGLVLLVASAYWVIRMVAAMFRSQVILAGQPLTRKRFFKVLMGRLD